MLLHIFCRCFSYFTVDVDKAMKQKTRRMRLQTKSYLSIKELSEKINPVIRGWINYYGHFRRFEMYTVLSRVNKALVQWVRNKYKKRRGRMYKSEQMARSSCSQRASPLCALDNGDILYGWIRGAG